MRESSEIASSTRRVPLAIPKLVDCRRVRKEYEAHAEPLMLGKVFSADRKSSSYIAAEKYSCGSTKGTDKSGGTATGHLEVKLIALARLSGIALE